MKPQDPAELFPDVGNYYLTAAPDEMREGYLAHLAHLAVFHPDPRFRTEGMPQEVERELARAGVSPAVRAWIGWVMREIEIPHRVHHRPQDSRRRMAFILRLANFILDHEKQHPDAAVLDRLHDAAEALHKSFGTVKAAYYKKGFSHYLKTRRSLDSLNNSK